MMTSTIPTPASLVRRPCAQPNCTELVTSGRCAKHQRADEARPSAHKRGYDSRHERLRVLCFQRDQFKCVDCGWEPAMVRAFRDAREAMPPLSAVMSELRLKRNANQRHLHADHEIPVAKAPELQYALDNLRTRCNACHAAKTAREDGGFGNGR